MISDLAPETGFLDEGPQVWSQGFPPVPGAKTSDNQALVGKT